MTYHGKMYDEKRDKPRLDSVKLAVELVMTRLSGQWHSVNQLHPWVEIYRPCREDTVRRMIDYLIKDGGTETHTFHSRPSTSNPGTAIYQARKRT